MQLVEVDVIGLQALQTAVQCLFQILAVEVRHAAAHMRRLRQELGRSCGLGRQDHLLAVIALLEPSADDFFGGAIGFGARRHRIHLGSVDEIDPGGDGGIQLLVAFRFGVLLTPSHRAQADEADLNIGVAQWLVLHGGFVLRLVFDCNK